jgi:hypothetical protein
LAKLYIPVPKKISIIKNPKKRESDLIYYISSWVCLLHGPVVSIMGLYFLNHNGTTYSQPNSPGEIKLIYVKKSL